MNVLLGVPYLLKIFINWVRLDDDVSMHQVNRLGCFMVIDASKHFKSKVKHHFDWAYGLDVVCKSVVHHSRVLQYVFEVNDVLSATSHVETTVKEVSTKVVKFVNVKRVSLIGHNLEHPISVFVLVFVDFALNKPANEVWIKAIFLNLVHTYPVIILYHILEKHF